MNKLDEIVKVVEIKKRISENETKIIHINKIVYMDDLKIFINCRENPLEIDNKIIELYHAIGMNINEKKSGIAKHGGMEIPNELTNKYSLITKENRCRYFGFHIYEVNENSENEEFIITKINETLNELEPLDFNNRTIIKCINTQVIGQIRYYIGSVIFTVGCIESVDIIIR